MEYGNPPWVKKLLALMEEVEQEKKKGGKNKERTTGFSEREKNPTNITKD